jgi:hypothetical protein
MLGAASCATVHAAVLIELDILRSHSLEPMHN